MLPSLAQAAALALTAVLLLCLSPSPLSASVICSVYKNGRFVCTRFCPDGFICDSENNKCLPGPAALRRRAKLNEDARLATLASNRTNLSFAKEANRKTLGYDLGSTYYAWDGDPREVPTPRHIKGGMLTGQSKPPAPVNKRGGPASTIKISSSDKEQLLVFLAAARSFDSADPNRAGAVKLLRDFARKKKIPIDVDELLDCGTLRPETVAQVRRYPLHGWRVPDIDAEIEKRGVCAGSNTEEERDACKGFQFGQIVMEVEPDLKAICKLQENDFQERDLSALGECAERKFRNAWARRDGVVVVHDSGTFVERGAQCPIFVPTSAEALTKAISDNIDKAMRDAETSDEEPEEGKAQPPGGRIELPDVALGPVENERRPPDEDPFCAFIARRAVRGALTPGGGATMPDYCRRAMDEAKSCAQQNCSMADVIDEQERNNARKPLPWGSEDYKAIADHVNTVSAPSGAALP